MNYPIFYVTNQNRYYKIVILKQEVMIKEEFVCIPFDIKSELGSWIKVELERKW